MFRFGLTLFIALNLFSAEKLNEDVLSELSAMIMSDSATQALIVSHNGNIVLEQYGKGYGETDFVTSQSIAKAFYAVLFGVAIEKGLLENLDEPIVILRADSSVKHGLIINLLDELRKIENLKIGILTEKK